MRNREGFWKEKGKPEQGAVVLPKPISAAKSWKGKKEFMLALRAVELSAKYTRQKAYKGWSECRCCKIQNGSESHFCSALKSEWEWPSGYMHYVAEHNVRPSLAFQEFILAVAEKIKTKGKK